MIPEVVHLFKGEPNFSDMETAGSPSVSIQIGRLLMKLCLTSVLCFLLIIVSTPTSGRAQTNFPVAGDKVDSALSANPFIATGIKDIRSFLERCPTNDPAYAQIRQDFELLQEGQVTTSAITCSEPISSLPISQLTDELIAMQVFRTAYYMGQGTEGKLPWTPKGLYAWMASTVAGVNLRTAPGIFFCCQVINGKKYFSASRQDATQREFKRTWTGIAGSLNFYAHEIHHADPGAPGHTTGCAAFPLPTDPPGCDATYNISNLGSYGVQYWLESSWATGYLNIGIGCSPPAMASSYANWNTNAANDFRRRFVNNVPPVVTATLPYGGPCTLFGTFLPVVIR